MPYARQGAEGGVICEDLDMTAIGELVKKLKYEGEGKGMILNPATGVIVASANEEETLKKIRETLLSDGAAEVHNEYETFYGAGFDGWLRNGLKDLPCKFRVTSVNHWEGYPWTYIITLDIDELAGGAPCPSRGKEQK